MKYYTICTLLLLTQVNNLFAQAASDSPYSNQKFDPAANEAWYTDPFLLAGVVIVIGAAAFLWRKKAQ